MLSAYPRQMTDDQPEEYLASIAMAFEGQPVEWVKSIYNPVKGLPSETKYPPTVADVVGKLREFNDAEMTQLRREREERERVDKLTIMREDKATHESTYDPDALRAIAEDAVRRGDRFGAMLHPEKELRPSLGSGRAWAGEPPVNPVERERWERNKERLRSTQCAPGASLINEPAFRGAAGGREHEASDN